jgi:hypothetical protein
MMMRLVDIAQMKSSEDDDYMQLVLPRTQKISDSDDGDIVTHDDEQMGMGGVSRISLGQAMFLP